MLFPTLLKDKLSQDLSYPLGAEAISGALAGVKQYELMSLTFHRGRPRDDGAHLILRFSYRPIRGPSYSNVKNAADLGLDREFYDITISSVPRRYRQRVRNVLLSEGIIAIKQWLEGAQRPDWSSLERSIGLVLHPAFGSLGIEESGWPFV